MTVSPVPTPVPASTSWTTIACVDTARTPSVPPARTIGSCCGRSTVSLAPVGRASTTTSAAAARSARLSWYSTQSTAADETAGGGIDGPGIGSRAGCPADPLPPRHPAAACLLYTSDAADDLTRVDLGGRRIIKKKKKNKKKKNKNLKIH